uniref:Uncharacterized protein n=1 Tax=Heterorhabditis bacteriophora TaxID=37862 RepID=A0A1I7X5L5_HETBA
MGLGKSFNTAAREAKRNYVMKRRARSGERDQNSNHSAMKETFEFEKDNVSNKKYYY